MKHKLMHAFGFAATGMLALAVSSARADAVGPYYASPSWDQTIAASTRFVVLSNLNSDVVLDRETGLVWEKAPSADTSTLNNAWKHCLHLQKGGRMGWRLPKSDELFSLLDPTQISNVISRPAALPVGHPFVGTGGNPNYWTTDQDAPPFNNNGNLVYVAADGGVIQTADSNYNLVRAWCVRGPGSAQISP
jgi:hypothetical protein